MDISRLDLNLLRTFREVLDTGSVAGAAHRLNVTPSAISHALRRLRDMMDDPLFIRSGNVLSPTSKAQALGRIVAVSLDRLTDGLQGLTQPEHSDGVQQRPLTLRIAAPGALELTILPALARRLRIAAPAWRIEVTSFERRSYKAELLAGTIDLVLSVGGHTPVTADLSFHEVWQDELVCVMSRQHPLATREAMTMKEYLRCNFIYPLSWPAHENYLDVWLARSEQHRAKVISLPSYAGVGAILEGTDLVASMPDRTALALRRAHPELCIRRVEPRMVSPLRLEGLSPAKRDEGVDWAISQVKIAADGIPGI